MRNTNQFRGCLIGGAAGDALGIPQKYKERLELHGIIIEIADNLCNIV